MRYTYDEISKPARITNGGETPPNFPSTCPLCGAKTFKEAESFFEGPIYTCRGQYTYKPQIQCHTNYWWGSCLAKYIESLEAKGLLEAEAVVWAVKENGRRIHVGSFSSSSIALPFARGFSKDYPRFWDDESKVVYIEVLENKLGDTG